MITAENPKIEIVALNTEKDKFLRYYGTATADKNPELVEKTFEIMPEIGEVYKENGWEMGMFYLDDATAKCVGEYDMEESNPHTISGGDYYDGYDMMFFKNSVISDDLCATDNLKDKLRNSPYKSTFQDIDMIDPNFFYQKTLYSSTSIEVDDDLHQIIKYVWKDGSAHYYDKFIKLAENGDFDEIVFITLPYVDISEDEMKKKFLADKIYLSYEDKVKHMVKKVKK